LTISLDAAKMEVFKSSARDEAPDVGIAAAANTKSRGKALHADR